MSMSNIARFALIPSAIAEQSSSLKHVRNLLVAAGIAPRTSDPLTAPVRIRSGGPEAPINNEFSVHEHDKWRVERLVQQVRESVGATRPAVLTYDFVLSDASNGSPVRTNEELDRAIARNRNAPTGTWLRYTLDSAAKAKPRAAPPSLTDALADHAARARPLLAVAAKIAPQSDEHFERFKDSMAKGMAEASSRITFGHDEPATRAVLTDLLRRNEPALQAMGVQHVQYVAGALATDFVHLASDVSERVRTCSGAERQRAFDVHVRRSEVWPELKQWISTQTAPLAKQSAASDVSVAAVDAPKNAPVAARITNINAVPVVIQDKLPDWSATTTTTMEGRDHVKEHGYEPLEGIGKGRCRRHRRHHHHGPVGQGLHNLVYGEPAPHHHHQRSRPRSPSAGTNGANGHYYPPHYHYGVAEGVAHGTGAVVGGAGTVAGSAVYGAGAATAGVVGGVAAGTSALVHGALYPFGNDMLDNDLSAAAAAVDPIACSTCGGHGKKTKHRSLDMQAQIGSALRDTEFLPYKPATSQHVGLQRYESPRGRSPTRSASGSRSSSASSSASGSSFSRSPSPTALPEIGKHIHDHGSRSSSASPSPHRSPSPMRSDRSGAKPEARIGKHYSRSPSSSHSPSPSRVMAKIGAGYGAPRSRSPSSSRSPSPSRVSAKIGNDRAIAAAKAPVHGGGLIGAQSARTDKVVFAVDRDLRPIRNAVDGAAVRYDSPPRDNKPSARSAPSSAKIDGRLRSSQASVTFLNGIVSRAGMHGHHVVVLIEGEEPLHIARGSKSTIRMEAGARKISITAHNGKVLVPERTYAFSQATIYTCVLSLMNVGGALMFMEVPHLATVDTAIRAVTDRGVRLTLVDPSSGKEYRLSDSYTKVPLSATSVRVTRDDGGAREYKKIELQSGALHTIGAGIDGSSTWLHSVVDFAVPKANTAASATASAASNESGTGFNFLE